MWSATYSYKMFQIGLSQLSVIYGLLFYIALRWLFYFECNGLVMILVIIGFSSDFFPILAICPFYIMDVE